MVFGADVPNRFSYQMHDTALYYAIFKDGLCTFLKARYLVHTDKKHILHTPCPDLVKYLHPVVFPFRIANPQSQDILDTIYVISKYNVNYKFFVSISLRTDIYRQSANRKI